MKRVVLALTAAALAACAQEAPAPAPSGPNSAIPPDVEAAVLAVAPGAEILTGESDESDGEFEVTAMRDGVEYEFDLVQANGAWSVAEIQRDIAWADAPEPVRAAAAAAPDAFEPVRVIESTQPVDNAVVYELFSTTDVQGAPSMEVRWFENEAAVTPPAH